VDAILTNAAGSAQKRLFVALFTPLTSETQQIAYADNPGAPDISFCIDDLLEVLAGWDVDVETMNSPTQYGVETLLRCKR